MKKNILLVLILFISFVGCGSKSNSSNSKTAEIQTFINLEELKAALDEHIVVCGEMDLACPSYTAKLVFWGQTESKKEFYLGVCSGSLYDGKYIITNSHCIPKEIAFSGASCENQIKALFPTTKNDDSESARCKKIIQVFNPSLEQPDIAVIELDRVLVRGSVEIAKDSFSEDSKVSAFTMNPEIYNQSVGTIIKKTCTLSADNALLMKPGASAATGVVSGLDCDIIGGNSGSALLKDGKLVGVIFARFEVPKLAEAFKLNGVNFTGKGYMGLAQNITCLNDITKKEGISCDLLSPKISDFDDYVERVKAEQNLSAVSDSQIEYEMTLGFKLKLSERKIPLDSKSLTSFRDSWLKIFFKNTSTLSSYKPLSKFMRE